MLLDLCHLLHQFYYAHLAAFRARYDIEGEMLDDIHVFQHLPAIKDNIKDQNFLLLVFRRKKWFWVNFYNLSFGGLNLWTFWWNINLSTKLRLSWWVNFVEILSNHAEATKNIMRDIREKKQYDENNSVYFW